MNASVGERPPTRRLYGALMFDVVREICSHSLRPHRRAKRRGLARDAAVALGNVASADDVELLRKSLEDTARHRREYPEGAVGEWRVCRVTALRWARASGAGA